VRLCFLARLDRVMGDRRGRLKCEPARRTGARFGRSNRFVAADGLLAKYGPGPRVRQPYQFRAWDGFTRYPPGDRMIQVSSSKLG
jgi:hypothetical protein